MECCELCLSNSPRMHWKRPCCRIRFLLGQPPRFVRLWLLRWQGWEHLETVRAALNDWRLARLEGRPWDLPGYLSRPVEPTECTAPETDLPTPRSQ